MRTFYIFKITDAYYELYQENGYLLFDILEQVNHLNRDDIRFVKNLYEQIVEKLNKIVLNEYIYNRHIEELTYTKYHNTHMIYDIFTREESNLVIHNTYVKLMSTLNFSTFAYDLFNCESHLFLCDFATGDYFWLEKMLKELV